MSQTKQLTQTIHSILNTLPSTSKPPLNYENTIVTKCLEKIRILNTKLGYEGCLGKNDHRQSRVAICLEYVIRRDLSNYSGPPIPIESLAQSVGMRTKMFLELKGKMDHYFEDDLPVISTTQKNMSLSQQTNNNNDLIQKLVVKIGSQGLCDSHERVAQNGRRLLINIEKYINETKIKNIRNAAMNDFQRKKETYAAVCFYITSIQSQNNQHVDDRNGHEINSKKRNEVYNQLRKAVVTAAKLTPQEFDHVLKHVNELLQKSKKDGQGSNIDNKSMTPTLPLQQQVKGKKRKRNDASQENLNDIVNDILSQPKDVGRQLVDENDENSEPTMNDVLKDIINKDCNEIEESDKKSITPNIIEQIEMLKRPLDECYPKMPKTFVEWKNRILEAAKINARKVLPSKHGMDSESERIKNFVFEGIHKESENISDREALSNAAYNCLEKLSVYHENS